MDQKSPNRIDIDKLIKDDLIHFWHPFTDIDDIEKNKDFPIFTKGKGSFLYDINGKEYIDGISSWWCVNLGHSHPDLINAVVEQINTLPNCISGNASNDKVIRLSKELSSITPKGLVRSFFCSDGSSAVECGLRIARQYFYNIEGEKSKKKRFVHLNNSYHGDTLGSISVGYSDLYHKELKDLLPNNIIAKPPSDRLAPEGKTIEEYNKECIEDIENIIKKNHEEIIGVIIEPIFQGAGGINVYNSDYLKKLEFLCKKYNVLLIADEIATGFYRTGHIFASIMANIEPDIMIIGKGLTGGYLPMSAAITTEKIYNTFRNGHTLFYGHTFSGNPTLANLALAAIDIYKKINKKEEIDPLCELMKLFTQRIKESFPEILISNCGMVCAFDFIGLKSLDYSKVIKKVVVTARKNGLFIRNIGTVIYLFPPINIPEVVLKRAFSILENAIKESL